MKRILAFILLCLIAWAIGWSAGAYFPSHYMNQENHTKIANTTNTTQNGSSSNNSNVPQAQQPKPISTSLQSVKGNSNLESSENLAKSMKTNELVTVNSPSQLSSTAEIDPRVNDVVSLPQKFASENINYEWALARENELKEIFHKDPAFQGRQVLGVTCKSSLCEIKVTAHDTKQLNAIGSDIMRLISQINTNGFEQNIMITYSQPEESGSFYIKSVNQ